VKSEKWGNGRLPNFHMAFMLLYGQCEYRRLIMVRKIFKMDNSLSISLPKDMVAQLGWQGGDEVSVSIDAAGEGLIVKPEHSAIAEIDSRFANQIDEFVEKYGPALEALSK
jgi:putative addiction module antidote